MHSSASWTQAQRLACAVFLLVAACFVAASALLLTFPADANHGAAPPVPPFVPPLVPLLVATAACGFLLLAYATYRGSRWAYWADLILLGFQIIGAIGALASLLDPALAAANPDPAVRAGLDPTLDGFLHLVVSLVGAALFLWLLPGLLHRR